MNSTERIMKAKYFLVICFWILAIVFGWFQCQSQGHGWYILLGWVLFMTITLGWLLKYFKTKEKEKP